VAARRRVVGDATTRSARARLAVAHYHHPEQVPRLQAELLQAQANDCERTARDLRAEADALLATLATTP
jgi:hypothetical protein